MGNITRKELGARIRAARLAKNCSIEKLSWLTGYTKDWLSWLENGDPYEKMLSETGKALGVDLTADTPDDWKKEIEHEIEIAKKDRREIETRNERDRECFKRWQEEMNKKQDELKKTSRLARRSSESPRECCTLRDREGNSKGYLTGSDRGD